MDGVRVGVMNAGEVPSDGRHILVILPEVSFREENFLVSKCECSARNKLLKIFQVNVVDKMMLSTLSRESGFYI